MMKKIILKNSITNIDEQHLHAICKKVNNIPRLLNCTLDPYLILLSAKQGGITYHF